MKNNLDIILGVIALIGITYRVFQVEKAIYDSIDELNKLFIKRMADNEYNFGVHVAAYCERKEQIDYLIHALQEEIDHKANRLLGEIKELKGELKHKQKSDEG
ncbi:hypothetical protein NIES4075_72250 [Tolypothrix sp. NIES-4075]|uniref:hypothetical protein n=1 Tax=Tolypothrix sp. NIES-4075 TaxID=2005459 RepID=UPI000B5C8D84|nr:hypothetical protein [Tolypothrix sp. NIES-4075]GAX46204.1 hypothetical protein NIES4075_72250 [Tolypothrix sp. NIES-4075]